MVRQICSMCTVTSLHAMWSEESATLQILLYLRTLHALKISRVHDYIVVVTGFRQGHRARVHQP